MEKICYTLDASFLVRLLTGDPLPQFHLAVGFLEQCEREGSLVEVLDLILAEAYFALQYHYGFPKEAALKVLHQVSDHPVVALSKQAMDILGRPGLSSANLGFVDLLIHGSSRGAGRLLVTFEKKARKLEGVIVLE